MKIINFLEPEVCDEVSCSTGDSVVLMRLGWHHHHHHCWDGGCWSRRRVLVVLFGAIGSQMANVRH